MNHDASETVVAELQAKVERINGSPCGDCGQLLCGHQALFAIALGVQDRPVCCVCLARSLGRAAVELSDELQQHIRHRECYGTVWKTVSEREPACPWTAERRPSPREIPDVSAATVETAPHVDWDAGDLACGDLLLQLRLRLRDLAPGTVFRLLSRDRGAVEDIPAWCRITGHRLLSANHPVYCIERKSP